MAEFYTYVLLSEKFPKTYVGISLDINKRLEEHNSGSNSYSRKYRPWKIIYTERHPNRSNAVIRERYLKSHAGRNFLKKLINIVPR